MEETPFDAAELALETEVVNHTSLVYYERARKAADKGQETMTDPVHRLMAASIEPVAQAFQDWKKQVEAGPGRRATAYQYVGNMNPKVFALLALRQTLNTISKPTRLQSLAKRIGTQIERELKLAAFEQQKPALYRTIDRRVDASDLRFQAEYRVKVLLHAANKHQIAFDNWGDDVLVHIGALAVDLITQHTGFLERFERRLPGRPSAGWYVGPTEELVQHLEKAHLSASVMHPTSQPMICRPLPHQGGSTGGHILPTLREPLIKSRTRGAPDLVTPETAPKVYQAVNGLQNVAWEVNEEVLKDLLRTWELIGCIPKASYREDRVPDPEPSKQDMKVWRLWKAHSRKVFYENRANRGKRLAVVMTMSLAQKFVGKPIWFPYKMDFRGRMYTRAAFLAPQGADLARGLLRFSEAKEIGERGIYWLKVHVANTFGYDKASFDDRVSWVDQHRKDIEATAADPLGYHWWHEADSPVQFLAACKEIAGAWSTGPTFKTQLPITFDGTCNGLQHLAAMMRDPGVGALVNLAPSDKPQSIYELVAASVNAKLKTQSENVAWAKYGMDRAGAKRPTMIVPYNGGVSAFVKYLREWVDDRATNKGIPWPFPEERDLHKALFRLARCVSEAIDEAIPLPRAMMKWSKGAVKVACGPKGKAVRWTTPTGFVVTQEYPSIANRLVKTRLGDKVIQLQLRTDGVGIDTRRQTRAFAPNFIHSYDAAHQQLTICWLLCAGITSFFFNHDAYGVHACHAEELHLATRETFIEIYAQDVRMRIKEELQSQAPEGQQIPEPPPMGDLNIEGVRNSRYFFG